MQISIRRDSGQPFYRYVNIIFAANRLSVLVYLFIEFTTYSYANDVIFFLGMDFIVAHASDFETKKSKQNH